MALFAKKETEKVKAITPTFYPLDVDELYLAPYQRGLKKNRSRSYADRYDPDIFGIILVSFRGGKYYIIDGQHRVEAARMKGIKTVWCQVLTGLTYEQECDKFYKINNSRSALNANHKFNALVEQKEPTALEIVAALNRYGLSFSKEGNELLDNCVTAVGSLRKIYSNGEKDDGTTGYDTLCTVLSIVKRVWNGDRDSLRAEILKGIDTFLRNYECDKEFLIKVLERIAPKGIIDRAKANTSDISRPYRSDGTCFHIAKTIRDMYDELAHKTKGVATCGSKAG